MIAFNPTGAVLGFTGANSAPTSVQALSANGVGTQQYCLTNTDVANDCIVGWGSSDAIAKLQAVGGAGNANCYYLLARSQVVITGPVGAFFSGITPGSGVTAVIKVQAGHGA